MVSLSFRSDGDRDEDFGDDDCNEDCKDFSNLLFSGEEAQVLQVKKSSCVQMHFSCDKSALSCFY